MCANRVLFAGFGTQGYSIEYRLLLVNRMAAPALPKNSAAESVQRTTLSEAAHQAIRGSIITGVLAPGSKLVVSTLAHSLRLSATPINEALAGLEREGLVTCFPHRGYFVRTVIPEDIEKTYSVREAFELVAVRHAAKTADKAIIQQLRENLQKARQALQENDTSRFSDLDMEFHRIIWNSLDNSLAMRVGELIGVQIRLLVATTARAPGRFRGAFEEHNDIHLAIRSREPARAASSMKTHLHNAKIALEHAVAGDASSSSAKSQPESKRPRTAALFARPVPNKKER